ncbi:MAG: O-antigen ligase family protein [Gemmatimonadota bacterium]|jgi:putative inorganic carbon (HCO3(-)) transporter|nr:O-antigen ligase family protein [Gemmatimonadota bacterium]
MSGSVGVRALKQASDHWNTYALERLQPAALWRALWTQSPAFWCIQLYVMFEYVRPQTVYPWIDIAPWSTIVLVGAVLGCFAEARLRFTAKALWLGVAMLTTIILLSAFFAYSTATSWANRDFWINWLLLMVVVGAGIRTRRELLLLLVAFGLWNLKMSQHAVKGWVAIGFSFRDIGIGGAPGWFQNSGEFGIEMCIFLPLTVYFGYGVWPRLRKWGRIFVIAVAASILFSIVASSSRGALLGAAALALWAVWQMPNRLRSFVMIGMTAMAIWAVVPAASKQRLSEMGDDKSSITRLTYWSDGIKIANDHPVLGVGFKNWLPYYTTYYNPKGQLPHNFMIEAVAELGYAGAIAVLAVIALSFRETARIRRRCSKRSRQPDRLLWAMAYGIDGAMIGFMVSGSFVSVLYYPFLWMNVAFVMALARVEDARPIEQSAHNSNTRDRFPHSPAQLAVGRWAPRASRVPVR